MKSKNIGLRVNGFIGIVTHLLHSMSLELKGNNFFVQQERITPKSDQLWIWHIEIRINLPGCDSTLPINVIMVSEY